MLRCISQRKEQSRDEYAAYLVALWRHEDRGIKP